MTGAELDEALATVLAREQLSREHERRRRWQDAVARAKTFEQEDAS